MKKKIVLFLSLLMTMTAPITAFAAEPDAVATPMTSEIINPSDIMDNYIITRFDNDNWNQYSTEDKSTFVVQLIHVLAKDLACPVPEIINIISTEPDIMGMYDSSNDCLTINTFFFLDGEELRDTVTHEMRHVWQHWQAEQGTELGTDILQNQKAYIDTNYTDIDIYLENQELGYFMYVNQPVEVDARSYSGGRNIFYEQLDNWYQAQQ